MHADTFVLGTSDTENCLVAVSARCSDQYIVDTKTVATKRGDERQVRNIVPGIYEDNDYRTQLSHTKVVG